MKHADAALAALKLYADLVGEPLDERAMKAAHADPSVDPDSLEAVETAVVDLLADLRHLVGQDVFDRLDAQAATHFHAEEEEA